MKKPTPNAAPESDDEMLAEYDFTGAVRGKYAQRYAEGTNLILLDPEVMDVFPDAAGVNSALRALAGIIRDRRRVLSDQGD
jgi:hypothetical protein